MADQKDRASKEEKEKSSEIEIKVVTFRLENELYGLPISQVKEVASFGQYTTIPNSPSYILGLLDLRGDIILLVDLQKRFRLKPTKANQKRQVVVCQFADHKLGIVVDGVEGIISLSEDQLKDPEEIIKKKISPEFLLGVVVYNDQVLVVLNVEKLSPKEEIERLKTPT